MQASKQVWHFTFHVKAYDIAAETHQRNYDTYVKVLITQKVFTKHFHNDPGIR